MTIQPTRTDFRIVMEDIEPLGWLAYSIEAGALWWFGRGIWRIQVERHLLVSSLVTFTVRPIDQTTRPLAYSNISTISQMTWNGLFPARLVEPWKLCGEHKHNSTLINLEAMKPDCTIGMMAYGLADGSCNLFKLGATMVRAQYSRDLAQIAADVGMDSETFRDFANLDVPNYELGDYVGLLPPMKPK